MTAFASKFSKMDPTAPLPPKPFVLNIEAATLLTEGTLTLPPMSSVPCSFSSVSPPPKTASSEIRTIREIVMPPNVDSLYEWYATTQSNPDADASWAVLWPTAVSLTNRLLLEPTLVQGRTVIELGSGLGLCGLAAASLGAKSVVLTDRDPFALHCALSTAAVNKIPTDNGDGSIRGAILDWKDSSGADGLTGSADVILASDVLYDSEAIEAFAGVCRRIAHDGTILLVTDPKTERCEGARESFRKAMHSKSNNDDISKQEEVELEDLPIDMGSDGIFFSTPDGKDHGRRMKEPTVLLRYKF
eukprot:CAMPEP_0113314910 /NCGR_PEP_ID=MMETSP0010_2-20120614/10780_1 /TAXON_ID=216773 ORGANISM="Corethron hystrix, Strain 308" /NCGR_SAMPLE_ID=MMETSP0010_2 /ASSEMBLY_ACC=CAM_ASM_000155 /LENGTH=301 /DNA_ID=CAMNT_0000171287 /DNA_START=149 /DNA_END=1054 /DNA_ORIENTATION=+ /assembly_acc=CAM_ASM_000155